MQGALKKLNQRLVGLNLVQGFFLFPPEDNNRCTRFKRSEGDKNKWCRRTTPVKTFLRLRDNHFVRGSQSPEGITALKGEIGLRSYAITPQGCKVPFKRILVSRYGYNDTAI
jgi:hypothetical protein